MEEYVSRTLISIIVPVYNTENYLGECIDSILDQTFKSFELILIDDGSTDKSGIICDKYAKEDNRILVIHKKNEGVSAARNTGLDKVSGKYILFFDSDDTILPTMLEDLVTIAEREDADIVQSAGPIITGIKETGAVKKMNRNEVLDENFAFSNVFKPSLWLGIYNSSLFEDIRFPVDIHFYEDFTVLTLLAAKSDEVVFLDKRYYNYRQREGSANHSGLTEKRKSSILIPNYLGDKNVFRGKHDKYNTVSFFVVNLIITTLIADNATASDFDYARTLVKDNVKSILFANVPKTRLRYTCFFYLLVPSLIKKLVREALKKR